MAKLDSKVYSEANKEDQYKQYKGTQKKQSKRNLHKNTLNSFTVSYKERH